MWRKSHRWCPVPWAVSGNTCFLEPSTDWKNRKNLAKIRQETGKTKIIIINLAKICQKTNLGKSPCWVRVFPESGLDLSPYDLLYGRLYTLLMTWEPCQELLLGNWIVSGTQSGQVHCQQADVPPRGALTPPESRRLGVTKDPQTKHAQGQLRPPRPGP